MRSYAAAPETAVWPQPRQSSVAAGRRPQPFVCGVCSRQRRADSAQPWLQMTVGTVCATAVAGRFREAVKSTTKSTLLVDADQHGPDDVIEALRLLRETDSRKPEETHRARKKQVEVIVFAAQEEHAGSKEWKQVKRSARLQFEIVPRTVAYGDPNDAAIDNRVRKLAEDRASRPNEVAILASDSDFVDTVNFGISRGMEVVAIVPENRPTVLRAFEPTAARLLMLPAKESPGKVRAVLHADGRGEVMLCDPVLGTETPDVFTPLLDLGYCTAATSPDMLMPSIVNFWVTNNLGDLTVFPYQRGVQECSEALQSRTSTSWARRSQNLAFVLPTRGRRKSELYGTSKAAAVFHGGGPFVIPDTPDLVQTAMQKLGYIEAADYLEEVLLVFCNHANNKHNLRKLGLLPDGDEPRVAAEKVREAMLSSGYGFWEMASSDSHVRAELVKTGRLPSEDAPRTAVSRALRRLLKEDHVPPMSSYCGKIWQATNLAA
ncbi:unnamed protein product [Symbiodinium sp. CCMP2592]|nr:unnamed protein product [Symbiodinium sp. CCMP2592]